MIIEVKEKLLVNFFVKMLVEFLVVLGLVFLMLFGLVEKEGRSRWWELAQNQAIDPLPEVHHRTQNQQGNQDSPEVAHLHPRPQKI